MNRHVKNLYIILIGNDDNYYSYSIYDIKAQLGCVYGDEGYLRTGKDTWSGNYEKTHGIFVDYGNNIDVS